MRAALVAALACAACSEAPAPVERAENAVLITLDTTRADALGRPGVTPHLDALARESVVYVNARTVAPVTLPAHASMLTGLAPPNHGVRDNGRAPLSEDVHTVAEQAHESGIRTAAFVAAVVLDPVYGLDQGFDVYDAPARPPPGTGGHDERPAREVIDGALRWLDGVSADERFLLWVHLFEPHAPYAPSREALARAGGDAYLGEVADMDAEVGRLVDALRTSGRLATTLVVVAGDHGEGLGEHGEDTHSAYAWDSTLRVPFLVRLPDGRRAGERSDESVSVMDVAPTIAAALGLGAPRTTNGLIDGRPLYDARAEPGRLVYFEALYGALRFGWSPLVGVANEDWKYVHSSRPELFAVATDRGELRDLALAEPETALRFRNALAASIWQFDQEYTTRRVAERSLEALGYGSGPAGELAFDDRPHPVDRLDVWVLDREAWKRVAARDWTGAIEVLERMVRIDAANPDAWLRLGGYRLKQDDAAGALSALERFEALGPPFADARYDRGLALLALERDADAEAALRAALELDGEHERALKALVRLLESSERANEAAPLRARLERLLNARVSGAQPR